MGKAATAGPIGAMCIASPHVLRSRQAGIGAGSVSRTDSVVLSDAFQQDRPVGGRFWTAERHGKKAGAGELEVSIETGLSVDDSAAATGRKM
jgi:hypothetical protein